MEHSARNRATSQRPTPQWRSLCLISYSQRRENEKLLTAKKKCYSDGYDDRVEPNLVHRIAPTLLKNVPSHILLCTPLNQLYARQESQPPPSEEPSFHMRSIRDGLVPILLCDPDILVDRLQPCAPCPNVGIYRAELVMVEASQGAHEGRCALHTQVGWHLLVSSGQPSTSIGSCPFSQRERGAMFGWCRSKNLRSSNKAEYARSASRLEGRIWHRWQYMGQDHRRRSTWCVRITEVDGCLAAYINPVAITVRTWQMRRGIARRIQSCRVCGVFCCTSDIVWTVQHRIWNRSVRFHFFNRLWFWHRIKDSTSGRTKDICNGEAAKSHRTSVAFLKACAHDALVNRL